MINQLSYVFKIIFLTIFILSQYGCGIYRKTDAREVSPDPDLRVQKNLEEGKGLRLDTIGKRGNGEFQFASSNPMWRATIDVLEFAPLLNANYSGGIVITDWMSTDDPNENNYYKLTVKFLSNEIRPDGLNILIHQKNCDKNNVCKIQKIESAVENELKMKILKVAALYEKDDIKRIREELGAYPLIKAKTGTNSKKK
jgi:mannosyltransferase OCH1-like enzyme